MNESEMVDCRHCNGPMRLEIFKGRHIDGEARLWICSNNKLFGGLCRSNIALLDPQPAKSRALKERG